MTVIDLDEARKKDGMKKITQAVSEELLGFADSETLELPTYSANFAISVVQDVCIFLESKGYDLSKDPNLIYDLVALIESCKAIIYRLHGEELRMHHFSRGLFDIEDPKGELYSLLEQLLTEEDSD